MRNRWVFRDFNTEIYNYLTKEVKIDSVKAKILASRNKDLRRLNRFLNTSFENLHSPLNLPDIEKAIERIFHAINNKEKILLFTDYDTDGVCSVCILKETFQNFGLKPQIYIPHRLTQGYGLGEYIIDYVKENKITLLITSDCGTSDTEIIEELKKIGTDTIVIDHHFTHKSFHPAFSFINPKRPDSYYPFKDLVSTGLVFKLSQLILGRFPYEFLDLVVLATVCDCAPLIDENRIFIKEGLKFLRGTNRLGLRTLMNLAGVKPEKTDIFHIGFIIGPRINAPGRLHHAKISLELLSSESVDLSKKIAQRLESLNSQRQRIQRQVLDEALFMIEKDIDFKEDIVLVLSKENWHLGVLGIVASKIKEEFFRPCILLSLDKAKGRGSGRSIEEFDITWALNECREFLYEYGGHKMACGLSVEREKLLGFKKKMNEIAKSKLSSENLVPAIFIDSTISFKEINQELVEFIKLLEPFGEENPEPVFLARNVQLKFDSGEKKVFFSQEGLTFCCLKDKKLTKDYLKKFNEFDVVFSLKNTNKEIVLILKDIKPASHFLNFT